MTDCTISHAGTRADIAAIRGLFMEYQQFLRIDLDFQDFGAELAGLPGKYAPPRGALLLARCGREAAGCVAFYPLSESVCELKRLYVRPAHAGKGVGRALLEHALAEAANAGYATMRLDSLRRLTEAGKLYRHYGFREIAPYNHSPEPDAYHMERALRLS